MSATAHDILAAHREATGRLDGLSVVILRPSTGRWEIHGPAEVLDRAPRWCARASGGILYGYRASLLRVQRWAERKGARVRVLAIGEPATVGRGADYPMPPDPAPVDWRMTR